MIDVTFITGNQAKADYLAKYLGLDFTHQKVELDEIQSLDLKEIVKHKVLQAYDKIGRPVLVEGVSLEFKAFGRLPGTFIKFYVEEVPFETICRSLDGLDRSAVAKCVFGYYDGNEMQFFEGQLEGTTADNPAGDGGYGWDKIFIPKGHSATRVQLSEADDQATYLQIKPFAKMKAFFENLGT